MATTDTQLQQLVINVGTEDQIAAGIASGTITEDMLSIATDGADITYDWVGTLAEYNTQQIATLHPDWLCFITDDVSNSGEDVYANVYSKTEANETFVAKTDGVAYLPNLLEFKWSDHLLNSVSWLRADTFSWQSGDIYEAVYQHLLADVTGKALQSETISGITIQYYEADDKHKICPASQESNISSLYDSTGVAWYYILDETNQKFKLPRTKFGFEGIKTNVGKYVAPGLPNITGAWTSQYNISLDDSSTCKGAIASTYSTGTGYFGSSTADASWGYGFNFDASKSNSIYGASSTVQSPATEMYLYFYVGEFTDEAVLNTIGITAEEFNDKVDVNLLNSVPTSAFAQLLLNAGIDTVVDYQAPTSENNYTWYRKYKSGWVEQGGVYDRGSVATSWNTTITLPVMMQNANYTAIVSAQWMDGDHLGENGINVEEKTTSSLKIYFYTGASGDGVRAACWEVRGMAASNI